MAKGLVGGMIWGGLASVVGAGALSLAVGLPPAPEMTAAAPPAAVPAPGDAGAAPAAAAAPVAAPVNDTAASSATLGADAADQAAPTAGAAADALATPQPRPVETPDGGAADAGTQAPASQPTPADSAPGRDLAMLAEPVLAAPPEAPADSGLAMVPSGPAPQAMPEPAPTPEPVADPASATTAPPAAGDPAPVAAPVVAPPAIAASVDISPAAEAAEATAPAAPQVAARPSDESSAQPSALPSARVPDRPAGVPAIGTPAVPLTERAKAPASTGPRAIETHAAPFANPDNKPRMAIVLIDRGDSPVGLEALRAFPYPLTFAVDPARPDAAAAMARYRAAGFEVMALTDLPAGATAADVEQALAAILTTLPESVAVMEGDRTGVQASKEAADQVTAMLAESGHGAVFLPKGLDTARKLAEKAGVPAATVFRDFDGAGQDPGTIRRFLDQAAFKAGQDEAGVIMLGRLRPETISALLLWGLQDRATRVALAPVSAVLRGE